MATPASPVSAPVPGPNSPFQAVIGLGPLKAVYLYAGRGKRLRLVVAALSLLAVPACLLLAVYMAFDEYTRYGSSRLGDALGMALFPVIGAGIAFLIGAGILFTAWRNRNLAAALYENGLAFNDTKGLRQVPWNNITAVYQNVTRHYYNGVYTGTTHVYTLHTNDSQKVVLDDRLGKQVEDLGRAIQSGVSNALFPRYVQALQSGQRLEFGPLALDREKLHAGKKELRWDEIKAIKIDRGQISVRKDKGWFAWASATVPQIPNFFIFYELLTRLGKVE